jgi:RNA polymerase sigma factor (sigma-70 family)
MIKDYKLTLKVQNNYLLNQMLKRGIKNVAELSRLTNITPSYLGYIVNLQTPAFSKAGKIYSKVQKLCDFFNCGIYDIFPEQHIENSLPKNKVEIEVNLEQLTPGYLLESALDPATLLSTEQNNKLVNEMLDTLTEKEKRVMLLRYGLDGKDEHSLLETGKIFNLSPERIRQIECKALRKLRRPETAAYFQDEYESNYY